MNSIACGLCGLKINNPNDELTVDHIKPISLGGGHSRDNLQPAHRSCNLRKGNGIQTGEPSKRRDKIARTGAVETVDRLVVLKAGDTVVSTIFPNGPFYIVRRVDSNSIVTDIEGSTDGKYPQRWPKGDVKLARPAS